MRYAVYYAQNDGRRHFVGYRPRSHREVLQQLATLRPLVSRKNRYGNH